MDGIKILIVMIAVIGIQDVTSVSLSKWSRMKRQAENVATVDTTTEECSCPTCDCVPFYLCEETNVGFVTDGLGLIEIR